MIEPNKLVADFAVVSKIFSPFAISDKVSMPSTAPRAKTPNLGVLVNALAVKYHYYFFLISSIKFTLTYL